MNGCLKKEVVLMNPLTSIQITVMCRHGGLEKKNGCSVLGMRLTSLVKDVYDNDFMWTERNNNVPICHEFRNDSMDCQALINNQFLTMCNLPCTLNRYL